MKKRMTALALALAMVATISVFAVTADGDPLYAAASMANDGAAYSEEAAKAAALEIFSGTAAAESAEEVFAAEEPEDEEPAAEPEPTPDAEGTLSFANLRSRMLENYYPLLALQESIDDVESHDYEWRYENLRKRLNEIARGQWLAITNPELFGVTDGSQLAAGMQSGYDTFRDQFDDIKDGKTQKDDEDTLWMYHNGQNMTIIAGEGLFMQIKGYPGAGLHNGSGSDQKYTYPDGQSAAVTAHGY